MIRCSDSVPSGTCTLGRDQLAAAGAGPRRRAGRAAPRRRARRPSTGRSPPAAAPSSSPRPAGASASCRPSARPAPRRRPAAPAPRRGRPTGPTRSRPGCRTKTSRRSRISCAPRRRGPGPRARSSRCRSSPRIRTAARRAGSGGPRRSGGSQRLVAGERVLLGREVVEEGARGDVDRAADLLDRHRLEPALGDQAERRLLQRAAGGAALALPQPLAGAADGHVTIISDSKILYNLKLSCARARSRLPRRTPMTSLARWAFRHRRIVVGLWIVLLVVHRRAQRRGRSRVQGRLQAAGHRVEAGAGHPPAGLPGGQRPVRADRPARPKRHAA